MYSHLKQSQCSRYIYACIPFVITVTVFQQSIKQANVYLIKIQTITTHITVYIINLKIAGALSPLLEPPTSQKFIHPCFLNF